MKQPQSPSSDCGIGLVDALLHGIEASSGQPVSSFPGERREGKSNQQRMAYHQAITALADLVLRSITEGTVNDAKG